MLDIQADTSIIDKSPVSMIVMRAMREIERERERQGERETERERERESERATWRERV